MLPSSPVRALALGRVTVQSVLGEPLRAEIDLPEITPEEAASLTVELAGPALYRAAGMEFPGALGKIRINLRQPADKRPYLQIGNDVTVNAPFVDLMVEARWTTGRLIRDYTLLLAPPTTTTERPGPTPNLAQLAATPGEPAAAATIPAPAEEKKAPIPVKAKAPEPVTAPQDRTVTVKPGDTASKLAGAHKPSQVSLDQMLVALLRSNPQAFIQENINWIKSGSKLRLPTEDQVLSTSAEQAQEIISAQSRDFNDYRKSLASNAVKVESASADRRVQGQVQTKVLENQQTTSVADRLTLSSDPGSDSKALDAVAKKQQRSEDDQRATAIRKNIETLEKLNSQASAGGAGSTATSSAAPIQGSNASADPATLPAARAITAPAATPSTTAQALPTPATSGALEAFLASPMVVPAAGLLLALLGAFGVYKNRQQKASNSPHLTEKIDSTEPSLAAVAEASSEEHLHEEASSENDNLKPDLQAMPGLDLDLELQPHSEQNTAVTLTPDLGDLESEASAWADEATEKQVEPTTFDFSSVSLDLDLPANEEQPTAEGSPTSGPADLATSKN
jgi:pilus assembly protein FimV